MACVACQESATPVLNIEGGRVSGVELSQSVVYRGIPYAAPPIGDLRWAKPQDVVAWDSVMIADKFSDAAVQKLNDPNDGAYGTEFYFINPPMSEDCLYLNVWTPKGASAHPEKKLPVAVWIHGGAFTGGWSYENDFDGEAWAERDVLLVTFNYRLGLYGFLCHPLLSEENEDGISGNYGLLDQIKALEWVHNNISEFGGDPDNITLFGQSAGAMSVKYLVSSPASKDLVSKVIIMSGGGIRGNLGNTVPTQSALDAPGEDMFNLAGMYSIEEMRGASVEKLNEVMENYRSVQKRVLGTRPHLDGVTFVEDFNDAVYNNTIADVPYMIGATADDLGDLGKGLDTFANVRDSLSEKPTFVYYFDVTLPDDGRPCLKGSFHSAELRYVFHTLKNSWRPFTENDEELSSRVIDYWTNFAKYGNPNGFLKDGEKGEWLPSTRENPYTQHIVRK